jgi:hypothetical protein
MRRTLLLVLALAAALVFAPAARADGTTTKILRDCIDDGILEGHYTPSELRKARDNMPTDAQEYSDCGDVLDRALAAGASSSGGGGGAPGGSAPGGGSPAATPGPQYSDSVADSSGSAVFPSTAGDTAAVADAKAHGGTGDTIEGRPLAPAASLGGQFGRNALPSTLIVVLGLLASALLAVLLPTIRRRVRARRAP